MAKGKGKRVHTVSEVAGGNTKKRSRQSEAALPQVECQRDRINKAIQAMGEMVEGEVRERLLGGFHNHDLATNGKNLLLSLPKEIRLKIFSLAVTVLPPIFMDSLSDVNIPTPGLLEVSKQVREEAKDFYYKNNDFVLRVTDFNVLPYTSFLKVYNGYGKSFPEDRMSGFWLIGVPNWSNLMAWCFETFLNQTPGHNAEAGRDTVHDFALCTMFQATRKMAEAGSDWKSTAKVLRTFGPLLVAMDSAWSRQSSV
ncbi:hypothetical protein LTR22_020630 [Elasticomyces elasticus]|nr:hypothetical protein LTR22_020630 [Elasticomyces elasticus]KAK4927786.1 hypothetical protein LTR49_005411 [Elasticomyces elasticus]